MTLLLSDPRVAAGPGDRSWAQATGAGAALYGPVLR
jgi:hypothetical protein